MLEADRPITKSTQDKLNRSVFAQYLARCILDHKNPESLVLGLYGGWGVGKTSVINLMLEELRFAASNMLDEEKPIILNFSPWSYSGQRQLVYNFFRRLSSELRQSPYLENAEDIIQLLELYVSFFTQKPIPKPLRFKNFLKSRFLNKKTYGWGSGRDLTSVKAELNALLAHQQHKIIIIIDNIINIDDSEIKQIFQIVKSMGDFSNTVYLLSMDKTLITNAIDRIFGNNGQAFLDKVIQLPFDVPAISNQDLENILLDKLKRMIHGLPADHWNHRYWADIYYSTLRYFFQNCRDIIRYVNTASFGFDRLKEVTNLVDFLAITAIEVFEPAVYAGIRDNKDLFTDLMDHVYPSGPEKSAEDKLRCDEILNRATQVSRAHLLKLLFFLFPRLRSAYEPNVPFYHSEELARKNRRICCPDLFNAYFRLSMVNGNIRPSELTAILALATKTETFDQMLIYLNQDNRIEKFLDLLDGIEANKISLTHIPHIINALMDNADLFPAGEASALSFNTPMRVHRIFHQLLRRLEQFEKRFDIFQSAIAYANKSLYIIIHELNVQSEEHVENTDTFIPLEHRDFTPEQLSILKKLAVTKIKTWVDTQRLIEHPKLIPILYAWKKWGDEEECKQFVARAVRDDKGLVLFLQAALHGPIDQAIAKLTVNAEWHKSLVNIDSFIPVKSLESHARSIFEDGYFEKLREREQLAILIFLDLIKAETVKIIPKTTV